MSKIISKKLLSDVLGENVTEVYEIGSNPNFNDNTILFKIRGYGDICTVNIHELAHKCKEWVSGWWISSGTTVNSYYCALQYLDKECNECGEPYIDEVFFGDTEPEAIFKACQWILDKESK